jgi:lipopolysaccharide transport system ATP-binding protein
MTPVISVEHLSKSYRLGRASQREGLRHAIESAVRSPVRFAAELVRRRSRVETFWALRDLSLDVPPGQVVGIIGRNGAGKSTLLKILSRVTEPTAGRIRLRGRVASLLEVGTGFHPELTGRENVFLNGAILGMSRAEIRRKFDEIVAFAEVERFLDTPIKRYSSGMQVRLAFAVAAHLEPEILIVDEVLAVGDTAFQKKCLGRMRDVSTQEGRTVLFVSHNAGALASLCTRGVVLEAGSVRADADIQAALSLYLKTTTTRQPAGTGGPSTGPRIDGIELDDNALQRGSFELRISFTSPFPLCPPVGGVVISDMNGTPLLGTNTRMHPDGFPRTPASDGVLTCRIDPLPLHSGEYGVSVWLGDVAEDYDSEIGTLSFHFTSPDFRPHTPPASAIGPLNVQARWRFEETRQGMSLCS